MELEKELGVALIRQTWNVKITHKNGKRFCRMLKKMRWPRWRTDVILQKWR